MTDEVPLVQQQAALKKDPSAPGSGPAQAGKQGNGSGRGGKRIGPPRTPSGQGGPAAKEKDNSRPLSRNSNKSSKKGDGVQRSNSQSEGAKKQVPKNPKEGGTRGGKRGGSANAQGGRQQGAGNAPQVAKDSSQPEESPGDALENLQRMISDLKSMAPPGISPEAQTVNVPIAIHSTLPVNAPIFQPRATAFPGQNPPEIAPRHRKSASLGTQPAPTIGSYGSYSPNLGSMTEDSEDQGALYEEGEITEASAFSPGHQPRSQSQSFTAPRFAALARQEQSEVLGPSGRPQLAPSFTFGARRRGTNPPAIGPAISEEDANFQFPQQQQQEAVGQQQEHRRNGSTNEITGLMAEQLAIQNQIEVLQQQQAALYHQQLASNQILGQTMPGRIAAHRRVQSTIPGVMGGALSAMGQFSAPMPSISGDIQQNARGHSRRHSVNVLNKTAGPGASISYPNAFAQEGFEDGFNPPPAGNAHSRQASRADSSWRMNGGVGPINTNPALTDLAQAQAQLQSLQQFRAAAGGHHQKLPSFSFPNMLPNMMAANMMGLGGLNLLQQQQQQFQMALQQQSSQPQRKSLFAPYLPQASLPPLLAAGKLVVGILRVNKRNRSDAYVATEVLDADIYICGSKDRNRALEGDIVAVELLDVDEVWSTKKEKEEKKRKKEENAAYDPKSIAGRKNDKKKDDVEVEGQGLMLFDDEE